MGATLGGVDHPAIYRRFIATYRAAPSGGAGWLGLENGIARLRVLISTAAAATNLLTVGEFEELLTALEAAVGGCAGAGQ